MDGWIQTWTSQANFCSLCCQHYSYWLLSYLLSWFKLSQFATIQLERKKKVKLAGYGGCNLHDVRVYLRVLPRQEEREREKRDVSDEWSRPAKKGNDARVFPGLFFYILPTFNGLNIAVVVVAVMVFLNVLSWLCFTFVYSGCVQNSFVFFSLLLCHQ